MLALPARAHAEELSATPETLAGVFAAANGGDTIRLASGVYGTFRGGAKPATVTLAPAPGAAASIEPSLIGASNLAFDGLTIPDAYMTGSRDLVFRNSRFKGMTVVDASIANANIVFDHDKFDGIDMCAWCYEGRLTVRGNNNTEPVGVAISNSHFGSGGESDGIQVTGEAYGVQIGPGNEFEGIKQGDFAAHVDPIQLYGDTHTVITGNYFHDNSTGIMAGDGTDRLTVTNNVFVTDGEYPDQIVIGGGSSDVIRHNTFANGARVRLGKVNVSDSVAETVTDNVITGGIQLTEGQSASGFTLDYNLNPQDAVGDHDVQAAPVFAGGSAPSSFADYGLAAGSPGKDAASDGADMGIDAGGAPPVPTDTGIPCASPSASLSESTAAPAATPSPQPEQAASGALKTVWSRAADRPPAMKLVGPKAGRLGRVLALHAAATDDVGVARVEFWLDGRGVANRARPPYTARQRVGAKLRRGSHTVSARVFDAAGQVTSVAAAIVRGRVLGGRVVSVSRASGGTDVRAAGFGRRRVVARLAHCGGAGARRVTFSRSRKRTHLAAGELCVFSLALR